MKCMHPDAVGYKLKADSVGAWCRKCGALELYRDGTNEHCYPRSLYSGGKQQRDRQGERKVCQCSQLAWRLSMQHQLYWCPKCGARKFGLRGRWEYPEITRPDDEEHNDIGELGLPLFERKD